MGHLSDKYGRRMVLSYGFSITSIIGVVRGIIPCYSGFITAEFVESVFSSTIYATSFLLAMEMVASRDRVLICCILTAIFPLGQIYLGVLAGIVPNYLWLLLCIYVPSILFAGWVRKDIPESIRWSVTNGHATKAVETIERAYSMNNLPRHPLTWTTCLTEAGERIEKNYSILTIAKQPIFIARFLLSAFIWFADAYITYGISVTSVSFNGLHPSTTFAVVSSAGIPAMVVCYYLAEYVGRRWAIGPPLLFSGVAILASKLLPADYQTTSLLLYFIAKLGSATSFHALYIYSGELWATNMRNSVVGLLSSIGRGGAMLSTFSPLMVCITWVCNSRLLSDESFAVHSNNIFFVNLQMKYWGALSFSAFPIVAALASICIFFLPETLGHDLPDIMKEAEGTEMPQIAPQQPQQQRP